MAGLSAQDIVRVTSSISPVGLVRRQTGRTLLLTKDATLGTDDGTRVRTYTNFEGVKADYAEGTEPYEAGRVYFSQEPFPRNLLIGQMRDLNGNSTPATSTGDVLDSSEQDALATYSDSGVRVGLSYYDFLNELRVESNVFQLDATNMEPSTIAAALQGLIEPWLNGFGITTGNNPFSWNEITSRFTLGADVIVQDGTKYVSGFSCSYGGLTEATDLSEVLKLDAAYGGTSTMGTAGSAESVSEALDAIKAEDPSFTFVCEERTMSDSSEVIDIAQWCAAERVYIQACASHDSSLLINGDQGTEFDSLSASENGNSFGTYSEVEDYKHISIAARMSSVNFSASNSLITAMFKILPQTATDEFTSNQAQVLAGKRVNFYSKRSGVSMYENGKTFSPNYWIDTKYWLVWFENSVLSAVFNLMYQSGKISQTEVGMTMLVQAVESVCQEGVRNGGIAAGKLGAALTNDVRLTTGNESFDGVLAAGYFVHSEPIAEQNQSDRNERKATPIKVWLKGSGAIQSVEIAAVFEQ